MSHVSLTDRGDNRRTALEWAVGSRGPDVAPTIPAALTGFAPEGPSVSPNWFRLYAPKEWFAPEGFHMWTSDCGSTFWTMAFHNRNADVEIRCTILRSIAHVRNNCPHTHPTFAPRGRFGYTAGFGCQRPVFCFDRTLTGNQANLDDVSVTWQAWSRVDDPA